MWLLRYPGRGASRSAEALSFTFSFDPNGYHVVRGPTVQTIFTFNGEMGDRTSDIIIQTNFNDIACILKVMVDNGDENAKKLVGNFNLNRFITKGFKLVDNDKLRDETTEYSKTFKR
ncbi:hypothetical protein [Microvirga sp. CF3016]|uniref:hypothetical protein n=1 Tax=Microvirga sp. CF3016 TaxID=3110181 RepID=UPI002E781410|nr:hypothetical protein [Microvirga sp. CF3016]MEE1611134.1 hypothetical protein [Microvirga sp. CF3016]